MSNNPNVIEATKENFGEIVEKSRNIPVLVDFWADWCGPCKQLMPVLSKLADEYQGRFLLAKVDTEAEQELAMHFGIRSLPTVKVISDGQIVDEFSGVVPESQIRELIDRYAGEGAANDDEAEEIRLDELSQAALATAAGGDKDGAINVLKQGLAEDPSNHSARITLAQFQISLGNIDDARTSLEAVPQDDRDERWKTFDAMMHFVELTKDVVDENDLTTKLQQDPRDCQALLMHGAVCMMTNRYESGMQHFLDIVKIDRKFNEDAGRQSLLKSFDMLDPGHELTARFRRELYTALN